MQCPACRQHSSLAVRQRRRLGNTRSPSHRTCAKHLVHSVWRGRGLSPARTVPDKAVQVQRHVRSGIRATTAQPANFARSRVMVPDVVVIIAIIPIEDRHQVLPKYGQSFISSPFGTCVLLRSSVPRQTHRGRPEVEAARSPLSLMNRTNVS